MCAQHPVTSPVKNGPEDDYLLVETCSLHITLCNNNSSCSDVQFLVLRYDPLLLLNILSLNVLC